MKKSNRYQINNNVKANIAAYRAEQARHIEKLRLYTAIDDGSKAHALIIQNARRGIALAQWQIANASDNSTFRSEAFALYNRARAGANKAKQAFEKLAS